MPNRTVQILVNAKDNASGVLGRVGKGFNLLQSSAMSLGGALTGIFAGVAIGATLKEAFEGAEANAQAFAKLSSVLESTGHAAGLTVEEISRFASARQAVTTFADDVTQSGAALLATFTNIKGQVFKDALELGQDMATVMGTDLKGAMMQLGKALNDPTKGISALARAGVSFTAEQKELIKSLVEANDLFGAQALVLAELRKEFGGAAEEMGKTMGSQLERIKTDLGDVMEGLAGLAAPKVSGAAAEAKRTLAAYSGNNPVADNLESMALKSTRGMGASELKLHRDALEREIARAREELAAAESQREGARRANPFASIYDPAGNALGTYISRLRGSIGAAQGMIGGGTGPMDTARSAAMASPVEVMNVWREVAENTGATRYEVERVGKTIERNRLSPARVAP